VKVIDSKGSKIENPSMKEDMLHIVRKLQRQQFYSGKKRKDHFGYELKVINKKMC